MNRAERRQAIREGRIVDPGIGAEITNEAIEQTHRTMHRSLGVQPGRIVNVEHQQAVGIGHIVLLAIDVDGELQAFALTPDNAGPAGRRMHECAADADAGLFVAGR